MKQTTPVKPPRTKKTGSMSPEVDQGSQKNNLSKSDEKDSLEAKRKLVEMVIDNSELEVKETDEVELNLTFQEYEKLFRLGAVTRETIRKGKVQRKDLPKIREALAKEEVISPVEQEDEIKIIDCGFKRIPSKKYKRDYIINRSSPQPQKRKWDVQPMSPPPTGPVVKATPAGWREQASLDDLEDEV